MSEIKKVASVQQEIGRLNTAQTDMVSAADKLTGFLFSPVLFEDFATYHKLLTDWANKLITITPFLPNSPLPLGTVEKSQPEPNGLPEFAEKLRGHETSLIEGVVIFLPNVFIYILAIGKIVPWLVPVLYSVGGVALVCAPRLIEWGAALSKHKDDEEDGIEENPTEWITHEIQILSDKYDGIRALIMKQDVSDTSLPEKYKTLRKTLYSRAQQEREFFPTECLNVVRKVMVYCNHAFYERKNVLISCLKAPTIQVTQPQYAGFPNQ